MADAQTPDATLVEKVTYPSYFEKLAAAGVTPRSPEAATTMLKLGSVVGLAVGTAVNRIMAARTSSADSAVKAAADAAFLIANGPPAPVETAPTEFMNDPLVKAAAAALAAERIKESGLGALMGAVPAPLAAKADDEEEDEKK